MKPTQLIHMNKTALTVALVAVIGTSGVAGEAQAKVYTFATQGLFTMLTSTGAPLQNTSLPFYYDTTWNYGLRTQISGTMTYDDQVGTGSMTIAPFAFYNGGDAVAANITFTSVGNGTGGTGPLVLGNMLFNWNGNNGIPVSIVWDATGLQSAMAGALSCDQTITGSGALPASNGIKNNTLHIGSVPLATTTWNTTTNGAAVLGNATSGTLPLWDNEMVGSPTPVAVSVGGSPMITAPFLGFNANFDLTKLTVTNDGVMACAIGYDSTNPLAGSKSQAVNGTINITLTQAATNPEVVTPGTFAVVRTSDSAPVPGTVTTGDNKTFTFTPTANLDYKTNYTASFTAAVHGLSGNDIATPKVWTFTTKAKEVFASCNASGPAPAGHNFTMLTSTGANAGGGANDVVFDWDGVTTSANVTSNDFSYAHISSQTKYSGFYWTAHHIRIFGPGNYIFNTACTTEQLDTGNCTANADDSQNYHITVPNGYYAVHMLFDWSVNKNIDVINLWKPNSVWPDYDAGGKNGLYTGDWKGASGYMVNINPPTDILEPIPGAIPATWQYVSTDVDGDGIIGLKMIDGPFIGFNANFNIGANSSCVAILPPPTVAADTQLGGGGCSLGAGPVNPLERGDWWLIAGFITWMGFLVKRKRT